MTQTYVWISWNFEVKKGTSLKGFEITYFLSKNGLYLFSSCRTLFFQNEGREGGLLIKMYVWELSTEAGQIQF